MNFVTSISLVVLGAMFFALLGWGSIRAAWRNCEGRRGVFAALAILAAICSIVAQKPSPDTPTITVDALLRDVGCYATNNVFHAAVTNAPSYAGVDFSDCDLMVYARERASTNAASWFELTPRKKFSQQPADYAIENATNFNYMVYLNYVPPVPVHTNGVFELYGFVIGNEAQGEPDQLAAGFINSRAVPLPFDAEVEYLESTSSRNAYFNTGIDALSDIRAVGKFRWLSGDVGNDRYIIAQTGTTRMYFGTYRSKWMFGFRNYTQPNSPLPQENVDYEFDVRWYSERPEVFINGESIIAYGSKTGISNNGKMLIFSRQNAPANYSAHARIYYCKIWQNGVLVRDYIAVRKGSVGYLYDQVSGQLFGNAGTGAFIVGPDK